MQKETLQQKISLLYDVVEVNGAGAIPVAVGAETVKLINAALSTEQASAIASESDSRGNGSLLRDDFVRAAQISLQNTDIVVSIHLVTDLTHRMRLAFRRRFLMYDAPENQAPRAMFENGSVVSMYRDIFDIMAKGKSTISRGDLQSLTRVILRDFPVEVNSVQKAALGDPEVDHIGFEEFMMCLQPTTKRRHVSDMLTAAQKEFNGVVAEKDPFATAAQLKQQSVLSAERLQGNKLEEEVKRLQMMNARSEKNTTSQLDDHKLDALLNGEGGSRAMIAAQQAATEGFSTGNVKLSQDSHKTEEWFEIETLRQENASLRIKIASLESINAAEGGGGTGTGGSRDINGMTMTPDDLTDAATLRARVPQLEDELRIMRAKLTLNQELNEVGRMLRQGTSAQQATYNVNWNESDLLKKLSIIHENLKSEDTRGVIGQISAQYEMVVAGYQGLLRKKAIASSSNNTRSTARSTSRAAGAASVSAARGGVVATSGSLDPSMQQTFNHTMSHHQHQSQAGTKYSVSQVPAQTVSWKELDQELKEEDRGTGLLSDPLLTKEERDALRTRMASQMRNAARHNYRPEATRSTIRTKHHSPTQRQPWIDDFAGVDTTSAEQHQAEAYYVSGSSTATHSPSNLSPYQVPSVASTYQNDAHAAGGYPGGYYGGGGHDGLSNAGDALDTLGTFSNATARGVAMFRGP